MTAAVLTALIPIVLLIGLGALRGQKWVADDFWPEAERLGYYVLLPALFLHGLASAEIDAEPVAALQRRR